MIYIYIQIKRFGSLVKFCAITEKSRAPTARRFSQFKKLEFYMALAPRKSTSLGPQEALKWIRGGRFQCPFGKSSLRGNPAVLHRIPKQMDCKWEARLVANQAVGRISPSQLSDLKKPRSDLPWITKQDHLEHSSLRKQGQVVRSQKSIDFEMATEDPGSCCTEPEFGVQHLPCCRVPNVGGSTSCPECRSDRPWINLGSWTSHRPNDTKLCKC